MGPIGVKAHLAPFLPSHPVVPMGGDRPFGKAIIADVRKNVAGAFVEQLDPPNETVRLGDTIILDTQPR
jgi:hypothetical protein